MRDEGDKIVREIGKEVVRDVAQSPDAAVRTRRRLLVIDPVGTDRWAEADAAYLRGRARPGTEIDWVTLDEGPVSLEDPRDEAAAVPGVLIRVAESAAGDAGFGGIAINCFLDPGLSAAREMVDIPVAAAGESALVFASLLARRFAILSVARHLGPRHARYAKVLGFAERLASVRDIGIRPVDLDADPALTVEAAAGVAERAVREDGAEAIILGCTGMARLARGVEERLGEAVGLGDPGSDARGAGVPVIEPSAAALKLLETLIDLGLTHSRVGLYARPDPRKIAGYKWPAAGSQSRWPAGSRNRRPAGGQTPSGASASVQSRVLGHSPPPATSRTSRPVRVLIINPLTSRGFEAGFRRYLDGLAHQGDLLIDTVNLDRGPASVETFFDEAFAVPAVLDLIAETSASGKYDGVVVNCFNDPAVDAARDAAPIPVVGPAEASMLLAGTLGHKFAVVSVLGNAAPWIERQARAYGLEGRLAKVAGIDIPVLGLGENPGATIDLAEKAAREAVSLYGAEVVILGCTGMAGLAAAIRERLAPLGVPVIEPAAAAVKLLQALVELRR